MSVAALSFPALVALFALGAALVAAGGVKLTESADRLADSTGLGEAVMGGLLLGMATSLSGSMVSVTAALDGRASLAYANGVGGIAAQTAFLAVADIAWRRGNLEHASAEAATLLQAAILTLMLGLVAAAAAGPEVAVLGVHPVSLLLPVVYVLGARAAQRARAEPMWRPVITSTTRTDDGAEDGRREPTGPLLLRFGLLALGMAATGVLLSRTGGAIADRADLSGSAVGALMTAVATSLPELVTTVAAVRRGAVQLAVGGIVGGNLFDVLFLTASDVAWRDGSIHHAVGPADHFWVGAGLAMTGVLLVGLIVRERRGPGGIGWESASLLALYALAVTAQAVRG